MSAARSTLKLFLDEGVPDSVGRAFASSGHEVTYLNRELVRGSSDHLVCEIAQINEAILVAIDGDMRRLAQGHGIGAKRFRRLSLIKLSCRETRAAKRVVEAMSLIEHEWAHRVAHGNRRLFIEISDDVIRSFR